jgi:hypothetical protein
MFWVPRNVKIVLQDNFNFLLALVLVKIVHGGDSAEVLSVQIAPLANLPYKQVLYRTHNV